jgi:hypothetical protein
MLCNAPLSLLPPTQVSGSLARYQGQMQQLGEQVSLLYRCEGVFVKPCWGFDTCRTISLRTKCLAPCKPLSARREYAAAASTWRQERSANEAALQSASAEAQAQAAANDELRQGIDALEAAASGDEGAVAGLKQKYAETVRRMAVVQVRGASAARQATQRFCTLLG